jgi:hypothetical protein
MVLLSRWIISFTVAHQRLRDSRAVGQRRCHGGSSSIAIRVNLGPALTLAQRFWGNLAAN